MNNNKKEGAAITTICSDVYIVYSVYVLHIIDEWMETKSYPQRQCIVLNNIRLQ